MTNGALTARMHCQSYACLVIVTPDWHIAAVSQNAPDVLGLEPRSVLDQPIEAVFAAQTAHKLRSKSQVLSQADPLVHITTCPHPDYADGLHVTALYSAGAYVFAFEKPELGSHIAGDVEQVQRLINRVAARATLDEAMLHATRGMRALTVADRVSLHPVQDGQIDHALSTTAGHPLQGRIDPQILSALSAQDLGAPHFIADVAPDTVPLVCADSFAEDLPAVSLVDLPARAASMAAREALAQNGIQGALMIPIRQNGALWGVMLCHHSMVLRPAFGHRTMLTVFATLLGYTLTAAAKDSA